MTCHMWTSPTRAECYPPKLCGLCLREVSENLRFLQPCFASFGLSQWTQAWGRVYPLLTVCSVAPTDLFIADPSLTLCIEPLLQNRTKDINIQGSISHKDTCC